MPVITIAAVAVLALAAGLFRGARVQRKDTGLHQALVQGAAVTVLTAAVALLALYTAAVVAAVTAVVCALLAARAFDRGRLVTAIAWTLVMFVCLSLTGLVGR
jgi:hypothetical protein